MLSPSSYYNAKFKFTKEGGEICTLKKWESYFFRNKKNSYDDWKLYLEDFKINFKTSKKLFKGEYLFYPKTFSSTKGFPIDFL